jgi:hypothetical protein
MTVFEEQKRLQKEVNTPVTAAPTNEWSSFQTLVGGSYTDQETSVSPRRDPTAPSSNPLPAEEKVKPLSDFFNALNKVGTITKEVASQVATSATSFNITPKVATPVSV